MNHLSNNSLKIDIEALLVLENQLYNHGNKRVWNHEYQEFDSLSERQWIKEHIDIHTNMSEDDIKFYGSKNLSKDEVFILWLFTSHASEWINHTLSQKVFKLDELQSLIVLYFDEILLKIKKYEGGIVFRIDTHVIGDKENVKGWFKKNTDKIIRIPWFLSTTTDEKWEHDVVWEIELLPKSDTHAHTIYNLVFNHGNEFEVRFERNAKFFVKEVIENGSRVIIHLKEVEFNTLDFIDLTNDCY